MTQYMGKCDSQDFADVTERDLSPMFLVDSQVKEEEGEVA